MIVIVMGVSGSGKSTIGEPLAERLGFPYFDADEFHPSQNVAKMAAGTPLTDEDRWPWLDRIALEMRGILARGGPADERRADQQCGQGMGAHDPLSMLQARVTRQVRSAAP